MYFNQKHVFLTLTKHEHKIYSVGWIVLVYERQEAYFIVALTHTKCIV